MGWKIKVGAVLVAVGLGLGAIPASAYPEPPAAVGFDGACEGQIIALHNAERTSRGIAALREDRAFDQVARAWALRMATNQRLEHNPSYPSQIGATVPGWTAIGENVGMAPNPATAHTSFMNSTLHRGNILATRYHRIAVACVRDRAGRTWVTVNFVGHPTALADRRPAPFASAASATHRLRYWMLSKGPGSSVIEADTDQILSAHRDAAGFAVSLAESTAHATTVPAITRLYYATFLRHPDAPGLTYWVRLHHSGVGLSTVADRFAASREFTERYGTLSDADYVDRIYRNVLGRPPDDTGRQFWVDRLANGWTRGRVLGGFSESAEYTTKTRTDVIISWAWIQLIDRVPTAEERRTWTAAIQGGTTVAQVVTFLVRSSAMTARANTHGY